jgi:DNA repair protein RadC
VIGRERVSVGGVAGTVVDAKLIFQKAIQQLASSIILAHNHPSGNLRPSQADIDLTKKLKSAGKVLDIQVLDHLIISEAGYTSLADEQLMGN